MKTILIVDDHDQLVSSYREIFEAEGYRVNSVGEEGEALALVEQDKPDLVLLDIDLKGDGADRGGARVLRWLRERYSRRDLPVIVASGAGDTSLLVDLMQLGADDYEVKPIEDFRGLLDKIKRFLHPPAEVSENETAPWKGCLVGKSKVMMNLMKNILQAAQSESDVLIMGETGTGKDLVAKTYHQLSPRKNKPFYVIDLTKISSSLFESELYGYMPGAFSGAKNMKRGLIEEAAGGVAFLNEIGELPLEQQAKLLTLLETKAITRVGSTEVIKLNIVILAATNRDLKQMIEAGLFRKDLYYRLYNHIIVNPPLRDHAEDIPLLADHFIREFNPRYRKKVAGCHPEVLERFQRLHWEGNVRQFRKCIEQGVRLCQDALITARDLETLWHEQEARKSASASAVRLENPELDYAQFKIYLKETTDRLEQEYFTFHLKQHGGSKTKTAKALGINNYQQLNQMLKRLKLE